MSWFLRTNDSWPNLILRVTLGAVMLPHGAQKLLGWFGGYGFEYHLLAIAIAVVIVISGAGKWSVDQLLAKNFNKTRHSTLRLA